MQADYETFHVLFNEYRELMLEAVQLEHALSHRFTPRTRDGRVEEEQAEVQAHPARGRP